MFENLPNNTNPLEEKELKRREEEKHNGFPSDKLGQMECPIRDLFDTKLNSSEIYSLLLTVLARNIEKKNPSTVLSEYRESKLLEPSSVNYKDSLFLDSLLINNLDESYDVISPSPIVPSGAVSAVNKINPKTILQTIKGSELVSDTSVALALEAAVRRSETDLKKNLNITNLAASQREVRLQQFSNADFSPHFNSFTIASASRDTGRFNFEKQAMFNHIDYFLKSLISLNEVPGYDIKDIIVEISDISIVEKLIGAGLLSREMVTSALRSNVGSIDVFAEAGINLNKRIENFDDFILPDDLHFLNVPIQVLKKFEGKFLPKLKEDYPNVLFQFRLDRAAGIGYFDSLCYKIRAKNSKDEVVPIVDGGASDWTAKFLSDSSERFFGSGIGSDHLIKKFNKNYE